MSIDDIPGKWQLVDSNNFDEFMSVLGVGYLTRYAWVSFFLELLETGRRLDHISLRRKMLFNLP